MLRSLQEDGRSRVGVAVGLAAAVIVLVVLVPCVTCSLLRVVGPQI